MSIKPDSWIREQCQNRYAWFNGNVFEREVDKERESHVKATPSGSSQAPYPMIEPFCESLIRKTKKDKAISYGLSSYGYDVRCSREFKVFTNINNTVIDPKNFDESALVTVEADECIIPPNSFALTRTVEYFRIPRNVLVVCLGKSTYARCGIIINATPIEPEFEGHVVIEISNTTNLPCKIYANEGIAQFLFFESDEACEVSYRDRGGKYQGQTGITLAKV